ncbi:MAG: Fe-only nitrogenase subunit beta [Clostridiales bacterium]|jgi:nitrogenase molybdenum-iron protein beta chain|nr:Fe-only nitrogenase subunit beta [Clostridiales bacterium]
MATLVKDKPRTGCINPIFNCQPCGAQFAAIGIRDTIALVHGGQGCCTFVRLMFAQHFKENFDIASSSLHEDAAVFGGTKRVIDGVKNLVLRYPDLKLIPIITTCSTETIGDDIEACIVELDAWLKENHPSRGIRVIPIHTPSYKGSQAMGYNAAMEQIVRALAKRGEPSKKVNVFTGWVNPGDVTELKHLFSEMGIPANILMDTETFASGIMPDKSSFAYGDTTVSDLANTANAFASVAPCAYEGGLAAKYLESEFRVPSMVGVTPIGIENTDKFLRQLSDLTGRRIPRSLVEERARAIDSIVDLGHMFLAGKRVAIYGDPDLVIGLADYCIELGMEPVLLLMGDDLKGYKKDTRIAELGKKAVGFEMEVILNADLWELERRLRDGMKLDLILGHSKGRFIAIDYQVPMVRVGFPVFDRAGMWKNPIFGYHGAEWLAEAIANEFFAHMEFKKDREWILNVW